MTKAKIIGSEYVSSDRKTFQGNSAALHRELNKGWEVAGGSNGSYVLAKPAQALFVFKVANKVYRYNMREDILDLFNKQRLTEKSFEKFKDMLLDGRLSVDIDENGYYTLSY